MFLTRGTVRIPAVFSKLEAARMVDSIWKLLEESSGFLRDDPSTWTEKQPTGFQSLTRKNVFNAIASTIVVDALDDLLGNAQWTSTKAWGVPLVTFPEIGRVWDVPQNQWHLDFLARGDTHRLPGIRVLAFIADVEPSGGGTVIVAGSHRLVGNLVETGQAHGGHSTTVRDALATSYPWFRALWSNTSETSNRTRRFVETSESIDGMELRVEELTGTPGDVILMHPWTFHAPAPNCGRTPRMMVSHSVYRKK